jgi:hypothetical protein
MFSKWVAVTVILWFAPSRIAPRARFVRSSNQQPEIVILREPDLGIEG